MDIKVFTTMLRDKLFFDLKKLRYKYPDDFEPFMQALSELYFKPLPIKDSAERQLVYIENHAEINQNTLKLLLAPKEEAYGIKAAENEIIATAAIENVDFSRDSVRNILKGLAPKDEAESRILGMKKGLEFISDPANQVTEENMYKLYMMTIGELLSDDDRLQEGCFYRHDAVYVVGSQVEHKGLDCKKVPQYMQSLIEFIDTDDGIPDLVKAAIIHFYIAYIHPYFDGNGRMARLLHLWFLIRKGYRSALFIPFSENIEKSRKAYYSAYTIVEENRNLSGRIDVTPFIAYMSENVYNRMTDTTAQDTIAVYNAALKDGNITEKEKQLWQFVLSFYGTDEFSTKQLEKAFGNAAYATIRGFVLKFEALGLLTSTQYGTRVKYRIVGEHSIGGERN